MFVLHAVVMAVMLVVSIDATVQTQQSKPSARKPAGGQPKTAQQLFHDAFEAYKANRFKEAMEQFEKGLQQGPTNALAAFYLGEVCAKTGDQAKAQSGMPQRWRFPQHAAAACRSSAQPGVARLSAAWPGGGGWVTVERQGFTGVEDLGTTGLKTLRGTPVYF